MFCSAKFWWQVKYVNLLGLYASPVSAEALWDPYDSGSCCLGVLLSFASKDHDLEGPHPGPASLSLDGHVGEDLTNTDGS